MYQIFVIPGFLYVQWRTHKINVLHKNDFIFFQIMDQPSLFRGFLRQALQLEIFKNSLLYPGKYYIVYL